MTRLPVFLPKFLELLNAELRNHPEYTTALGDFTAHGGELRYTWPDAEGTYYVYLDVASKVHDQYKLIWL